MKEFRPEHSQVPLGNHELLRESGCPFTAGKWMSLDIRSRQMTKYHGNELRFRPESFGMTLSAPFGDQVVKVHCGEKTRNDLTKQT